jgi:hypothetical protein
VSDPKAEEKQRLGPVLGMLDEMNEGPFIRKGGIVLVRDGEESTAAIGGRKKRLLRLIAFVDS